MRDSKCPACGTFEDRNNPSTICSFCSYDEADMYEGTDDDEPELDPSQVSFGDLRSLQDSLRPESAEFEVAFNETFVVCGGLRGRVRLTLLAGRVSIRPPGEAGGFCGLKQGLPVILSAFAFVCGLSGKDYDEEPARIRIEYLD